MLSYDYPRPLRERDNFNAFSIEIRERGKRSFLTAHLQNQHRSPLSLPKLPNAISAVSLPQGERVKIPHRKNL